VAGKETKDTEVSKDAVAGEAAPAAVGESKAPLLIALVNSLVVLGVLGLLVYTRILYKRPIITESSERTRLASAMASPKVAELAGLITFEPVTVNIRSAPGQPRPADGTVNQIEGKMHYITVSFAIEVRDISKKEQVEVLRPFIMDRMLSMLGRKDFHELATVQGRYVLRDQLIEAVNQVLLQEPSIRAPIATNLYFTQFVVQ
jgi:flagellar basal body-associated protein FliL